ncbi:hypothetical protein DDD_3110 [Nonlabens dokdonensis DSW-6]|uniref:Uncharacterized protein n=1 Tax=Nonlabens dokdonensis (strain DSM 17205 / KCTC 12402 / DSW-6) TaxID=592029 RepID=L7WDB0_NONDD|nr:hypothetical protein DDD_3110 [Nonlabens dokdonensis DSW-6]
MFINLFKTGICKSLYSAFAKARLFLNLISYYCSLIQIDTLSIG